ncbi:4-fold beta flower protein [Inquilinus limosus]|uniref:4-fold beta flower protein n=1 Tax=Inquilinus limosus TaxID=171674 RepID=UPI003D2EB72A
MEPLFSKDCVLVGWVDPGRYIFDTDMNYVAFISNGNAWSAATGDWLGSIEHTTARDRRGRPVTFSSGHPPIGTSVPSTPSRASRASRPARPSRPSTPSRPSRPSTPSGGWSPLSFTAWLAG